MSDVTLRDTFVMFCDWRGLCTWRSNEEIRLKLGDPIWTELSPESREQIQAGLGQVVTQRRSQRLEVVNTFGDRFRCWLWPLESPENAVCILGMRLPPKIDQLTDRERECLELVAQGIDSQEIGRRLDVSLSTVHTHMRRAREKLDLPSLEALISFAARYLYPTDLSLNGHLSQ
jgi:DNA-binding CsgD family transcriptional regulator